MKYEYKAVSKLTGESWSDRREACHNATYLPQIPRRLRLYRARGSAETATISPLCHGPAESEV
jgi:hypothetical protein